MSSNEGACSRQSLYFVPEKIQLLMSVAEVAEVKVHNFVNAMNFMLGGVGTGLTMYAAGFAIVAVIGK